MNLLYILQPSIYKPGTPSMWMLADSNVNMTAAFFDKLIKLEPTIKIDFVVPEYLDYVERDTVNNAKELFSIVSPVFESANITYREVYGFVHPLLNRYNFDVERWNSIFNSTKPDIVINNIAEISRNLKTIIETNRLRTKLITQCFWLDCPEIDEPKVPKNISIDWRQIDGFECSDLVVFTCQSTKNAFIENALKKISKEIVDSIIDKSTIWDFGFDGSEVRNDTLIKSMEEKEILFLNRFSDYTHYKEFIDAMNVLSEFRNDFIVRFTNPSGRKYDELERAKFKYTIPENGLSRKEYWKLLGYGDVSVHLFVKERYGGCALRESIAALNIPVVANCFEQADLVKDSRLLVDCDVKKDTVSILSIVDSVNNALNMVNNQEMRQEIVGPIYKRNYDRCEFKLTTKNALRDMNRLIDV